MGPIKNYREEERECATTSGKFNYFLLGPATKVTGLKKIHVITEKLYLTNNHQIIIFRKNLSL